MFWGKRIDHLRSVPYGFLRAFSAGFILVILLASTCIPPVTPYALARYEPAGNNVYTGVCVRNGEFQDYVTAAGEAPALRVIYVNWGQSFPNSPSAEQSVRSILNAGMIPVLTWEPYETSLDAIAGGSQDAYIDAWARAARAEGKPIFLRFAHEMNANWYPWNNTSDQSQMPAQYIAAYRRIYDRFQAAGATNVAFVWCVNWESRGPGWDAYYPGDSYVDWAGVDCYNWPRWPRTFDAMVSAFYDEFAARKPIMVCEVASAQTFTPDPGYQNPAAQDKARWTTDMFTALNTKYPRIKAVAWFNVNKETDWRVQSSASAAAAYRAGIAGSRYLGRNDIGAIINPSPSPSPQPGYDVATTHRWATYNNANRPVEQFSVTPGTAVAQSVYYQNTGNRVDSYTVSVSGIPAGWWRFTLYGAGTVSPGDGRYGNIYVTPAAAGIFRFNVTVTSNGNPARSSTQSYTLYAGTGPSPSPSPQPGYGVTTAHRWAVYGYVNRPVEQFTIQPGTTVLQSVYYRNTGTRPDSYTVSAPGLPAGWWAFTLYGNPAVQPGDGRYGNLAIVPAAAGDYAFTVTVTSNGDPAISSSQDYMIHVR